MNGVHDMGGMQNMGPIAHEKGEPVFHACWEGRVLALNRAKRGFVLLIVDPSRSVPYRLLKPLMKLSRCLYTRRTRSFVTSTYSVPWACC